MTLQALLLWENSVRFFLKLPGAIVYQRENVYEN